MAVRQYEVLETALDKGRPSRLVIEIGVRGSDGAPAGRDAADVQRAIREGFRDVLLHLDRDRLAAAPKPPKSRARRWAGRFVAFVVSAAIGGVATLGLSARHSVVGYALGPSGPASGGPATALIETPGPDPRSMAPPFPATVEEPRLQSQSMAAPRRAPAADPPGTGPATFGLHEQ